MKPFQRIAAGLASAVALALAATAFAQSPDPAGPGMERGWDHGKDGRPGPEGRMHGPGEHGPKAHANPAALVEARLAYLKTDLGISAAQQSAWNAFAAQARKQAQERQAMHEKLRAEHEKMRADKERPAVPERMEQLAEAMKHRAAAMESMAGSVRELYAALTPEQKKIADRDFAFAARRFAERHHGPEGGNPGRR